ncbi:unnamed protein product [Rhodiola kirilowii]
MNYTNIQSKHTTHSIKEPTDEGEATQTGIYVTWFETGPSITPSLNLMMKHEVGILKEGNLLTRIVNKAPFWGLIMLTSKRKGKRWKRGMRCLCFALGQSKLN